MKTRREFLTATLLGTPLLLTKFNMQNSHNDFPNVLIIGDSIYIGYTPFVRKFLKGKANVYRPMHMDVKPENCQGTTYGVKHIDRWIKGKQWDVIHFNFGLHDIKHVHPVTGKNSKNPEHPHQANLNEYEVNLKEITGKLKSTGAKLIFATTTPYPDEVNGPLRKPGMHEQYNEVAVKIMVRNNIAVNDLHAFVMPRMQKLQRPNNVHFTRKGSKALAKVVAEKITAVL